MKPTNSLALSVRSVLRIHFKEQNTPICLNRKKEQHSNEELMNSHLDMIACKHFKEINYKCPVKMIYDNIVTIAILVERPYEIHPNRIVCNRFVTPDSNGCIMLDVKALVLILSFDFSLFFYSLTLKF